VQPNQKCKHYYVYEYVLLATNSVQKRSTISWTPVSQCHVPICYWHNCTEVEVKCHILLSASATVWRVEFYTIWQISSPIYRRKKIRNERWNAEVNLQHVSRENVDLCGIRAGKVFCGLLHCTKPCSPVLISSTGHTMSIPVSCSFEWEK
jgi:hypothetical protein